MEDILRLFQSAGLKLNKDASLQSISETQEALGYIFSDDLMTLYRDHDGMTEFKAGLEWRLMPLGEVITVHRKMKALGVTDTGVRLFWSDDSYDYAALYIEGLLEGKICIINYDEADLSPAYRTLRSFLAQNLASFADFADTLEWSEMTRDYPATGPASDPHTLLQDWQIVQSLRPIYEASEKDWQLYYAACMMALTPYEYTDTLLEFVRDNDMYIQARACEILGLRRFEAAIDDLKNTALHGTPDGRSAAISALAKIGTQSARSTLEELVTLLPMNYRELAELWLSKSRLIDL